MDFLLGNCFKADLEYRGMKSDLVLRARKFAERKHGGQVRKDGAPYFGHLVRVAEIVLKFERCERVDELVAAAFLHDTLEDTDTGINELKKEFGEVVTLLVVELTTDKLRSKLEGKANYLSSKFSCERTISDWALVIKLADRLDNVSDLADREIEFAERMRSHTAIFLDALEKKRDLAATHKRLIKAIRRKLGEVDL